MILKKVWRLLKNNLLLLNKRIRLKLITLNLKVPRIHGSSHSLYQGLRWIHRSVSRILYQLPLCCQDKELTLPRVIQRSISTWLLKLSSHSRFNKFNHRILNIAVKLSLCLLHSQTIKVVYRWIGSFKSRSRLKSGSLAPMLKMTATIRRKIGSHKTKSWWINSWTNTW